MLILHLREKNSLLRNRDDVKIKMQWHQKWIHAKRGLLNFIDFSVKNEIIWNLVVGKNLDLFKYIH
jgi:uncharacterized protein YeeX (DUF496 family)